MNLTLRHDLRLLSCLAAIALVAACARDAEAAQRGRLAAWFALGETVEFAATMQCAVGLYRVTAGRIKAAMPVVGSASEMARTLAARGQAAWIAGAGPRCGHGGNGQLRPAYRDGYATRRS